MMGQQQQQQQHDEEHDADGRPKHRRSRKGCVRCRYLKKKCDEGTPCGRCKLSASECQYYRQPPYPLMPPTGRPPAPNSLVTNAVPSGGGGAGSYAAQTSSAYVWNENSQLAGAMDGSAWEGRLIGGGVVGHPAAPSESPWLAQQQQHLPPRIPIASSSQIPASVAAPSPPSNSVRDDGTGLFMDLSWQSSISALCSIGAPKATTAEFDFLSGGNFAETPAPWPAPASQPLRPPQERFTELEPPRQHQSQPLKSPTTVSPRIKAPPTTFPPFTDSLLDRPPELPSIPYLFSGSLGPRALPDGSQNELIQYFQNVTTKTIVAIDDPANNPYRTTFLSLWRPSRTQSTQPDANSALLHALFGVSAVHSGNLARARMLRGEIELEDFPDFGSRARTHRGQALRVLREAAKARSLLEDAEAAAAEGEDEADRIGESGSGGDSDAAETAKRDELEVTSAAVMLLVVQAVLEGDSKLVPLLLTNAESYIRRLSTERLTTSTVNLMMLHSVYTLMNNIARGRTLTGVKLLWSNIDESQAGLVKATLGISRNMMELWARAHSFIVRQREINDRLARQGPQGLDELRWEAAEIQNELDSLDIELSDEEAWYTKWIRPEEAPRVRLGHHFFRAAVRVYILRAGFGTPARDERVQACVQSVLKLMRDTPVGSEVGLSWPLLITGCEALGKDRDEFLSFVKRCQWKGSAPPVRVEQVLMGAWTEGRTWSETLEAVGFPLIL
ncbi:hypothetical protein RQP46_011079 [Phenoliferia psychrophenolica]